MDATFVSVRGEQQGILLVVNLGGRMVLLEVVGTEEEYQKAFAMLKELGVKLVITDDHAFYGPVESLGLQQQGCVWHAHRAIGRALRNLAPREREQWQGVVWLIQQSLKSLPWHPSEELVRVQALPLPGPLRYAAVYLLELWNRLTLYQRQPSVPRTNNFTERYIERSKMRARRIRGFNSRLGALNFFAVTQGLTA